MYRWSCCLLWLPWHADVSAGAQSVADSAVRSDRPRGTSPAASDEASSRTENCETGRRAESNESKADSETVRGSSEKGRGGIGSTGGAEGLQTADPQRRGCDPLSGLPA